jgi:hypothetical protein
MEHVRIADAWYGVKKIEADTNTGITYKWYHPNMAASDDDPTGILFKTTVAVVGTVTTTVILKRKGSWTDRAAGW